MTEHLSACRDFYRRWFELQVIFEASWFVLMGSGAGERAVVAFMHPSHPRFRDPGAAIRLGLRDEPFGQRRFGLFDPAGVWIDVVEQIEPPPGWWDRYFPTTG